MLGVEPTGEGGIEQMSALEEEKAEPYEVITSPRPNNEKKLSYYLQIHNLMTQNLGKISNVIGDLELKDTKLESLAFLKDLCDGNRRDRDLYS